MTTKSSARFGVRLQAWLGLSVAACVILPVLLRLERDGWTGVNIFFMTLGVGLIIFWVTRLVILNQTKRQRSPAKTDQP
jgi:tellurite resistance protein TehA-like permease